MPETVDQPDRSQSGSNVCSPSLREDMDMVSMWTDIWADEQCDIEERNVIQAMNRIVRACEQVGGPPHGQSFVTDRNYGGRWCPAICPVTFSRFFMWIEHPKKGWLPTYGGPFDSYTIPEPNYDEHKRPFARFDVEYTQERYDHDAGMWVESETVDIRTITEEKLIELNAWKDAD